MGKRTNTAKWIESAGRWQINVQKDGIRRTFVSSKPGRTGQREANSKADAWLEEGMEPGRWTLSQLFPEYLKELKLRTGQSHWRPVESRWRNWCAPVLGRRKPDTLQDSDLQAVIDRAYSQKKLSAKSLANLQGDLVTFVKWLRRGKLTAYRPEELLLPSGAQAKEKQILQPEALRVLFTVDTTQFYGKTIPDKYINAYRFQVLTGLRPEELLGLMPGDIEGDTVRIRRGINFYGEITPGKNRRARRTFALSSLARAVLEEQMAHLEGLYLFGIRSESHYRLRWKAYCQANNIPYITPYELRHTFVSIVQGLPEGYVKELVGHSRSMDTFGIYGHALEGRREQIASQVEAVFRELLQNSNTGT